MFNPIVVTVVPISTTSWLSFGILNCMTGCLKDVECPIRLRLCVNLPCEG